MTRKQGPEGVRAEELGELCVRAYVAGPAAYAKEFTDQGRRWPVNPASPAASDLSGRTEPLLVHMPVKLGVLAAAELEAIGTVLISQPRPQVGVVPLGRSVVEACSKVAWLLDNTVAAPVRHRRAWLLWAIAEGDGAVTEATDSGRTGAMSGSAEHLVQIERALERELGLGLDRSKKSQPKDWRLDGVDLPAPRRLVESAVKRWFPGADGLTLYSQVSRNSHSDVLVALGYVDDTLTIREGEALGFAATVLGFWGLTWNHVLSYLGHTTEEFDEWLNEMLVAIGRGDLIGP